MKKILVIILGFCVYSGLFYHPAFGQSSSIPGKDVQLRKEDIIGYIKWLIFSGCEQAVSGYPAEDLIDNATEGMKRNVKNDAYAEIHDFITLGWRIGGWLNENNWETTSGVKVSNCEGLVSHLINDEDKSNAANYESSIESFIASRSQTAIALRNVSVYQTTAKSLAEMYNKNEILVDDKIGKRKIEITGVIQNIRKNVKGNVVIELRSGNEFMPVRLSMDVGERRKASKLNKGQKTIITCDKIMFFVGSPSGDKCTID
ncbi:OB-fold protein [Lonsdalea quercina]|uniref:OB-fold protein n=1 Tax=Lonsdalea quercina TaxID=71657 RepID=UPI003976D25A